MKISVTPDTPRSFGYKMAWFAIPTEDSARVISAFGLRNAIQANWEEGIRTVYNFELKQAFVTPPVDGWMLVVGNGLPSLDTEESQGTREFLACLDKVNNSFSDYCYFGTHRVVEYHAWVRVVGRKIQRAYAYLGERGETLYDSGPKTKEEIALGFDFFDERSPEAASEDYFERTDLRYPDEGDVMKISAAWTINTQTLHERTEKGVGFLARIKEGA